MESGVDINEAGGKCFTLLQAAATKTGVINIMKRMLEKGAKVNIFGGFYRSVLNVAIFNDNTEAVSLLLRNDADPNIRHQDSLLIHHAVARDSVDIVQLMLDSGIDPKIKDEDGRSLLSYAIQRFSRRVVDYLLSRPDVQIHDTDLGLLTPLMEAVIGSRFVVLKRLLDIKADPDARDSEGKTPLIRAVTASRLDLKSSQLFWKTVVGMLLPFLRKEGQLSLRGELAFHALASLNADTNFACKKEETFNVLVCGGANLNLAERDGDAWTAYYTATRFGFAAIGKPLFEDQIIEPYGWKQVELNKPTKWHQKGKSPCLNVSEDGCSVTVGRAPRNPDGLSGARATIRANHCMPGEKVYYFEITGEEDAHDQNIGVGFCKEQASLNMMLGCDPGSWGYHGNDGQSFAQRGEGSGYGNTYSKWATTGCGVNFEEKIAFFTLDGELIEPAFYGIKGELYPAVRFSTERPRGKVTANF